MTDNEIVQAVRVCVMPNDVEMWEINFIWENADHIWSTEIPGGYQVHSLYTQQTAQALINAIHKTRCQHFPKYAALWN